MKIFLISTPWIPLPPVGYGGTERVVFDLYTGLKAKGHDVQVFATGDSQISGDLKYFYKKNLGVDLLLDKSYCLYFINHVYHALKSIPADFDIVHNHCETAAMHLIDGFKIPYLHTLHNLLPDVKNLVNLEPTKKIKYEILTLFKNHNYVSISNSQRTNMPELNYKATVYNAANPQEFEYSEFASDDKMCWLGRFSIQKGLDMAIEVAHLTGKQLIVAARIHANRVQEFNDKILPKIKEYNISYVGEIMNLKDKNKILGTSKLFLFPVEWEEPFGLTMIEAMACGTPVVAFARGSVPEVIKDGETGFIVNSTPDDIRGDFIIKKTGIEGLCEAVERIYAMPANEYLKMRKNCRQHVEQNFSVERMVDAYEKLYEEILVNR